MDFLGHGHSSHKHPTATYDEYRSLQFFLKKRLGRVGEVIAVADALNWKTFILMVRINCS
jgi:hypothetical protein